jgi:hypothetical protein
MISAVNDANCFGDAIYNDLDGDELGDLCEQRLADAFNPWLRYSSSDIAWDKEPTYGVRPFYRAGYHMVRIMYMLSYYDDAGNLNDDYCLYGTFSWCAGHPGDSEAIVLEVWYDYTTQHWILNDAILSQHTGYEIVTSTGKSTASQYLPGGLHVPVSMDAVVSSLSIPIGSGTFAAMQYAGGGHDGGAPDIWVATNKHANYPNDNDCNNGGGFLGIGHDTCSVDSWEQMNLYDGYMGARNMGSSWSNFANCLPSRHPAVAVGGFTECYWTGTQFAGWTGVTYGASSAYGSDRLVPWAF